MREVNLQKISFKSYLKLNMISGLGMGILFGIFGFIISFIDGESVYVTIGEKTTTGIRAGLSMLLLSPIMVSFIFTFFSIFLYLGFRLIMKFKKSIKIKVQTIE
jgi:hypothetical protein